MTFPSSSPLAGDVARIVARAKQAHVAMVARSVHSQVAAQVSTLLVALHRIGRDRDGVFVTDAFAPLEDVLLQLAGDDADATGIK